MISQLPSIVFGFIYFDPLYFLVVGPAFLLAIWAQMRVKSSFHRWSQVPLGSGWTGAQVAQKVCEMGGATGIQIEMTPGQLSDHYDPRERVLRLSADNYNGRSVAAAAIAAHEAGHAGLVNAFDRNWSDLALDLGHLCFSLGLLFLKVSMLSLNALGMMQLVIANLLGKCLLMTFD